MKRFLGMILAAVLFMVSTVMAESAVDVIMSTGTTQAFTDEAVPSEDLKTILRAGLSTESAINQQPWFFVAVTNPEIMKEIAGSGMNGFQRLQIWGKNLKVSRAANPKVLHRIYREEPAKDHLQGKDPLHRRPAAAARKLPWAIHRLLSLSTKTAVPNPRMPALTAALPPRIWSLQLLPWDMA